MFSQEPYCVRSGIRLRSRLFGGTAAFAIAAAVVFGSSQPVAASAPQQSANSNDPGMPQVVAQGDSQSLGDYMNAMVTQMESRGAVVGSIGSEWTDPTSGVITDVTYSGNKAVKVQTRRTFDTAGHAQDAELTRQTIASAAGTANGVATNSTKLSVHPPKAYFDTLTAVDQAAHARAQENAGPSPASVGLLEQLGLVGRADAASIVQYHFNGYPTFYSGYQIYGDLAFSWGVYWYNLSGQSGYHNAYLMTYGTWTGGASPLGADSGDRDAMDGEFDPAVMYQAGVAWSPDLPASSNYCIGGPMTMDSTTGRAWSGAYSQEPSHCSKANILEVDIRPKSSSSYGVKFNVYFNYTHTWNNFSQAISVTAGFGFLSVSTGYLGGSWNKNHGVWLIC